MYDQSFISNSFGEAAIFNVSVTRHGCHVRVFMFLAVLLKCTDGVHFLHFHFHFLSSTSLCLLSDPSNVYHVAINEMYPDIIQPYSGTVSHLRSCPVTVFVFTRPSGIVNSPIIICYFRAPPLLSLCFAGFEEERSELSPLFAAVNNKLKASGREKKESVFAETRSVREAKLFDPRQISRHACGAPGSVSLHSAILSHYKITNTNAQSFF